MNRKQRINKILSNKFNNFLLEIIDNSNLIEKAIEFFPEKNLDNTSWGSWCKSISGNSDYKGRDLFISLRKAITGFEYGPELSNLLPLIGKDKILSRMSGKKS